MNYLSRNSGNLLIATGIIHNALGFIMGWTVLVDIARSGFVNTVENQMDRNAIFWFLFGGFMMMILGKFMQDYIKESNKPVPASLGYMLLVLTVVGCIMMPISGFWTVLIQSVLIINSNRKASIISHA